MSELKSRAELIREVEELRREVEQLKALLDRRDGDVLVSGERIYRR